MHKGKMSGAEMNLRRQAMGLSDKFMLEILDMTQLRSLKNLENERRRSVMPDDVAQEIMNIEAARANMVAAAMETTISMPGDVEMVSFAAFRRDMDLENWGPDLGYLDGMPARAYNTIILDVITALKAENIGAWVVWFDEDSYVEWLNGAHPAPGSLAQWAAWMAEATLGKDDQPKH